jgi:hypothetical protein
MAHRTFTDSLGRLWKVWNVEPTRVERRKAPPAIPRVIERRRRSEPRALLAGDFADGWLAFETTDEKRRLANYPEEWVAMNDAELEQLCSKAKVGRPPRRLAE